jgi:hypothetical protein
VDDLAEGYVRPTGDATSESRWVSAAFPVDSLTIVGLARRFSRPGSPSESSFSEGFQTWLRFHQPEDYRCRKLAVEVVDNALLAPELAAGITVPKLHPPKQAHSFMI